MSLKDPNVVNPSRKKRVAIVIANPAEAATGWPVGFWWSELAHPWFVFQQHGYEVEVFSPAGGTCRPDTLSDPTNPASPEAPDLVTRGFVATPELMALVENTRKVADIDVDAFDAILVAGGQAPMFNFAGARTLHEKFAAFYQAGKVAGALCHGTAVLRYATLANGEPLVKGKTVTGYSNAEEDATDGWMWSANLLPRGTHVHPWRIEDELRGLGANYVFGGVWRGYAVRDGNLITGQQNLSGLETAQLMVETLGR